MTSGSFHSVPLDSIIIPEGRQRRELTDVDVLADSIRRLGLIHPIVITRDNVLVAGERRYAATKSLGHTTINAQYTDEVDPNFLHLIELEENVKRKDLSWHDECHAVYNYHVARGGSPTMNRAAPWSFADTAEALGVYPATVADRIAVAHELLSGNERVLAAPKFSTARGIVERQNERKASLELESLRASASIPSPVATEPESILHDNFLTWARSYSGPRFNLIHCDFPYGIGADNINQGGARFAHGDYADTPETYFELLDCLADNLGRLCTDSCHIIFWFSLRHYSRTLDFFNDRTDFVIDPFPLIWLKSDNAGILPDPTRGPRRVYETAFFGARGDRKILSAVANGYSAPTVRERHMSEKPEAVLRHFFRMLIDENTSLFDPTCGSGSALRAAESLGARHVLGLERNEEFAEIARKALKNARTLRKVS